MRKICRFIVNEYGEEETIKKTGRMLFINCPFKKSLKIYSFPKWKFRKKNYIKYLERYNITTIDWFEYSTQNVFFYLLLKNLEKHDCICFEFAGFDFSTIIKAKQLLLELETHIDNRLILIVTQKDALEENNILLEFPSYAERHQSS